MAHVRHPDDGVEYSANSDSGNKISAPFIIKELAETKHDRQLKTPGGFHLGQIVWAKVKGHCWWPAYLIKVLSSNDRRKANAKVNFIDHASQ